LGHLETLDVQASFETSISATVRLPIDLIIDAQDLYSLIS